MAVTTYQDIYGWETGANYGMALSGASASASYLLDGTAHTGCYYGKTLLRSAGGSSFTRVFSPQLSLVGSANGSLDLKARCYVRLATAPDKNSVAIFDLGNGSGGLPVDLAMRVNTDLTWEIRDNITGHATLTGGAALPLNTWFLVTLSMNWQRFAGLHDVVIMTVTANGGTLTYTVTFATQLASTIRVDRLGMGTITLLNGFSGVTAGEAHYDDLTLLMQLDTVTQGASVTMPASDRIRLIGVSAQGSLAAWTGSFTTVQEIPLDTAGAGQTSAGAGQVTTFLHSLFADFSFAVIDAFKIYGHTKATIAGPTTQQIRLNGVDYPVSITNAYQSSNATPIAVDWTTYTAGQFDAAEFGFVNSTGASLTLGAIHGEVLYTPGATNWTGCNAPSGVDPNPSSPGACVADMGNGTDSGGGAGCSAGMGSGADSGGGAGCADSLGSGADAGGGSGCQVRL